MVREKSSFTSCVVQAIRLEEEADEIKEVVAEVAAEEEEEEEEAEEFSVWTFDGGVGGEGEEDVCRLEYELVEMRRFSAEINKSKLNRRNSGSLCLTSLVVIKQRLRRGQ